MFRSSLARLGKNSLLHIETFISDIGSQTKMSALSVATAQSAAVRSSLSRNIRSCMMQPAKPRQAGCCSLSFYTRHGVHTSSPAKFGRVMLSRDVRGFNDSNGGGHGGGNNGGGGGGDKGDDESSGRGFFGMLWVMYLSSLDKNPVRI